jgi:outer membrane protein TolC
VERNYNILNSIDQFEDTKRKLRIAADQLKADLNFVANASLSSEPPEDYTEFNIDEVRYSFGLELDLPIDRLRERNSYRAALVNFEADIRNLALDLDSLKDQIERGARTLEQRRQNYLIQQNALELANRRVESSLLLLEAGRGTVLDLVDAQNEQIDAQNSVTAALVNYQSTRLELLLNIGIVETDSDKFWFRSQLENTPEIVATEATSLEMPRDALIPPHEVFSN